MSFLLFFFKFLRRKLQPPKSLVFSFVNRDLEMIELEHEQWSPQNAPHGVVTNHISTSRSIDYREADHGEVERGNDRPPTFATNHSPGQEIAKVAYRKEQTLDESGGEDVWRSNLRELIFRIQLEHHDKLIPYMYLYKLIKMNEG
ncbi:unnamed protein product [Cuscuta epithymum]|uniref:Uncharacterized protein n=1 Tax=Cuscuta epithymum TaxID=186058 RepID=A0AAV0EE60_9ASTE|nr:unnamed protein product [Cuscuta epithymum]